MSPRSRKYVAKRKTARHRLREYHPSHEKGRAFIRRLSILVGAVLLGFFVGKYFEHQFAGTTFALLAARAVELFGEAGADVFGG